MTSDEADDVLNQVVTLPTLIPRAARTDRVRTLCCARLDRDRRRTRWLVAISRFGRNVVAPILVGGLVALCGADLVSNAVRAFTA